MLHCAPVQTVAGGRGSLQSGVYSVRSAETVKRLWSRPDHKYQRVTPIFTRSRVHFLVLGAMSAQILKRCDVTDYKTFDTSAKAAKMMPQKQKEAKKKAQRRPREERRGSSKRSWRSGRWSRELEPRPKTATAVKQAGSHLPHDDDEDEHAFADAQWLEVAWKLVGGLIYILKKYIEDAITNFDFTFILSSVKIIIIFSI